MVAFELIVAFRRSLRVIALALCSMAIFAVASPASARPHHGAGHHARGSHAVQHHRNYRHMARWKRGVAQVPARGNTAQASSGWGDVPGYMASHSWFASPDAVPA